MKNCAFLHWIKVSNGETSGLLDKITNDKLKKEVQNLEDEIETELNCPYQTEVKLYVVLSYLLQITSQCLAMNSNQNSKPLTHFFHIPKASMTRQFIHCSSTPFQDT